MEGVLNPFLAASSGVWCWSQGNSIKVWQDFYLWGTGVQRGTEEDWLPPDGCESCLQLYFFVVFPMTLLFPLQRKLFYLRICQTHLTIAEVGWNPLRCNCAPRGLISKQMGWNCFDGFFTPDVTLPSCPETSMHHAGTFENTVSWLPFLRFPQILC